MMRVVVSESAGSWTWLWQVDLPTGCDVLFRGTVSYPDAMTCRAAAQRLLDAESVQAVSAQDPDGLWRLRFHDDEGRSVAVSADRFLDARTSRLELLRVLCILEDAKPRLTVSG